MISNADETSNRLFLPILILAIVFPSLATWVYFIILAGSPAMGVVYTASKIFQFSLPVLVVLFLSGQRLEMFRGGIRGTGLGLLFGAITAAAILTLYFALRNAPVFELFEDSLNEKLQGLGATTPARFAMLALFIAIFHSFLEEYYWRWFVFGQLNQRVSAPVAYGTASVGFAAHHVLVVYAYFGDQNWPWIVFFSISVAVGGAAWCWMFHRYNSLFAPWVSHLLVDAALLTIGAFHLWD